VADHLSDDDDFKLHAKDTNTSIYVSMDNLQKEKVSG
jgi:hypothetical protein